MMQKVGLIIITMGFIATSFIAVLDTVHVNWIMYMVCIAIGSFGLYLYKKGEQASSSNEHKVSTDMLTMKKCLANIVTNLTDLNNRKDELPPYEVRFDIDRLFREDLSDFAEARESMIHVFGLQNYADIMSLFAAGERYINRIWSASTDGYIDEVKTYLGRSYQQFIDARMRFDDLSDEYFKGKSLETVEDKDVEISVKKPEPVLES